MSKRRLTYREQLRKMIKEAEPNSVLSAELEAVRISIEKSKRQAITELIRLLKSSTHQDTKWFIARVLGTAKDERVIRPLMRAVQAPENKNYHSNFIWPLAKYDCTKHLDFFVNFMVRCDGPDESMMSCIPVIKSMKGPFEPVSLRKNIRKLLADRIVDADLELQLASEAFKVDAADSLMAIYFNYYYKAYWKDWGKPITERV